MSYIASDGRGEKALWAAVAEAAITDTIKGRDSAWIRSQDADTVLAFAGLDAGAVRTRLAARDDTAPR